MVTNWYTGIGSTKTPDTICKLMTQIAESLFKKNYSLRSGHAPKADQAFEKGSSSKNMIFLPWKGFEGSDSIYYEVNLDAFKLAAKFHPIFKQLSRGAQLLIARDGYQILGHELDDPSKFIICYTDNGKVNGGTGQGLRIAKFYNIPVYNLFFKNKKEELLSFIDNL